MRIGDDEFERAVQVAVAVLRETARGSRDEADALITYRGLSERLAQDGIVVFYHGSIMSELLAEASLREAAAGRGMISALVVRQGRGGRPSEPGKRFYRLARQPPFSRSGDDPQLWLEEVRRVCRENRPPGAARRVTLDNLGAWMLTCNPNVWDLAAFLELDGEVIKDWSVVPSYRTDLMAAGHPVLFWVAGADDDWPEPGLWGAGVVTGKVGARPLAEDDHGLWLDEQRRRRRREYIPVEVRLLGKPVPRSMLRNDPRLAGMEVFRQPQMANPLVVTREELEAVGEYLEVPSEQITVDDAGAGFGDSTTRAAVEHAAMRTVSEHYVARRWSVEDVSSQRVGWDLTCRSEDGSVERVEVKGVSGAAPAILLTRNEARAAREEPGWRLAVVTRALTTPELRIVAGTAAMAASTPFMYEVTLDVASAALRPSPLRHHPPSLRTPPNTQARFGS
jgi:hypothetical protein